MTLSKDNHTVKKLLVEMGFGDVIICDLKGAISRDDDELTSVKLEIAYVTNKDNTRGSLKKVIAGADEFIGVSRPNQLTAEDVSRMGKDSIIMAMATPVPEIMPNEAQKGGALVIGTGRSDFPNQINNVSTFSGVFKGALRVRAREITDFIKIAAALAIANMIPDEMLTHEYILPNPLNKEIAEVVADAVAKEALRIGTARVFTTSNN